MLPSYRRAATTPCTSAQKGGGTQQHHRLMTCHPTEGNRQISDYFIIWFSSGILSNIRQKFYSFFWTSNSVLLVLNQPGFTCIFCRTKSTENNISSYLFCSEKEFTPSFCTVSSVNRSRDSSFSPSVVRKYLVPLPTRLKMPKIITIIRQGGNTVCFHG